MPDSYESEVVGNMNESGRNGEGYADPTAAVAIRNMTNFGYRPVVYICSKYRGDVKANTEKARLYCRMAVKRGYIPLAPHLLFPQFMQEETERDLAMFMDLVILTKCAELWVCGEISEGMQAEISYARKRNMKIRFFKEEEAYV